MESLESIQSRRTESYKLSNLAEVQSQTDFYRTQKPSSQHLQAVCKFSKVKMK